MMKKTMRLTVCILLILSLYGCGANAAQEKVTPASSATNLASPDSTPSVVISANTPYPSKAAEDVSLSVVSISGVSSQGSFMGSGFIISEEGYIVTLESLIGDDADRISVSLLDGREFNAIAIGRKADIALLKISGDSFVPVEIGDSSKISVGDRVAAIRYSGEAIEGEVTDIHLETAVSAIPLIQTDIKLNLGDGGSPLADQSGRVIGITFMQIFESEKPVDSLSIPINDVTSIIQEIIDNSDADMDNNNNCTAETSSLGIGAGIVFITEENEDSPQGFLVAVLVEDGPAQIAGIQINDIIIAIDDKKLRGTDEFVAYIQTKSLGDAVELTVRRDDETLQIIVLIDYIVH